MSTQISSISLSVITLEEIAYGLTSNPNSRIQNWFDQFLRTYCQIIPITDEIAQHSGELPGNLRTQGLTRSQADMLIAATAHVHQLTLVTRNIRDFEDCGMQAAQSFYLSDRISCSAIAFNWIEGRTCQ